MNWNCQSCRYWVPLSAQAGRCHRLPPVAVPAESASFPVTQNGDWCGEFRYYEHGVERTETRLATRVPAELADQPLDMGTLSVRGANAIEKALAEVFDGTGGYMFGDLEKLDPDVMLRCRNVGAVTLREVAAWLRERGVVCLWHGFA